MVTVGKLKNNGDLVLKGQVSERLPVVKDGLVAHYPFDGTTRMANYNLLPNSSVVKTGVNEFLQYADMAPIIDEHGLVYYTISFDIKSAIAGSVQVYLQNGSSAKYSFTTSVPATTEYVRQSVTVKPTNGTLSDPRAMLAFYSVYGTGRIVSVKNVKIELGQQVTAWCPHIDDDDVVTASNVNMTNQGVFVEEATTNLVPDPHVFSSGWAAYTNGHDGAFMTEFGVEGLNIINRRSWCGARKTITLPAPGTYTLSVWVKPISRTNNSINLTLYTSGGGIGDPNVSADWSSEKIGKWQKLTMTQTYTTSTITLFLICFGGTNGPGYEITAQYTMPQIEQRSFATSFTVGSKGSSVLQLPKNVFDYKSFTVHMKLNFAQDMASGTNNMYFDAYPKLYLFRNGTNHIVSWYDSAQRTIGFNKCPNQEEFEVTVTRDYISPTEVVTKIYYDGVFIKSYTSTSEPSMFMNNQKGDFIKLNGWGDMYKPNNCIKTLSFYNRALTDKEVSELTSKRFSITKEGNLTTRILIEKNGFIPSDAVHIPLDSDSSDRNQIIKASEDVDTVYENGSVWVGSPATNEILKPDWSDTSGYTGFILTQFDEPMSPTGRGVKFQANDESINTAGRLSPKTNASANSGNHTFSVYAKGEGSTIGKAVRIYTGVSWYGNDGDMRLTNQYKKFTFTDLPYGTASGGFGIGIGSTYWAVGDVMYLHTPFLEARPFVSPVTIGNRGASSLEFNLNRDYGLDWSKDWSIVYWKRPIATHSNAFTGYNLDSLGSNSNSVGGGYIWWGKSSGSNIISQSTPSAIIPSEYFGNWRMVSLTKTGSTLTIREWDKNGTIYVRTEGTTTSIANYYVNQYGYDFKLGGYDNGNPMNSYYKDLIVAKREFSLTELGALFKSRMKSYKDRVQLSGTVSEGAML